MLTSTHTHAYTLQALPPRHVPWPYKVQSAISWAFSRGVTLLTPKTSKVNTAAAGSSKRTWTTPLQSGGHHHRSVAYATPSYSDARFGGTGGKRQEFGGGGSGGSIGGIRRDGANGCDIRLDGAGLDGGSGDGRGGRGAIDLSGGGGRESDRGVVGISGIQAHSGTPVCPLSPPPSCLLPRIRSNRLSSNSGCSRLAGASLDGRNSESGFHWAPAHVTSTMRRTLSSIHSSNEGKSGFRVV